MNDKPAKPPSARQPPPVRSAERSTALAQALRDNLKRRKAAGAPVKKDPA